ncbi:MULTISPECIES: AAA family ATPase [unclassified Lysobacter]|uniref:AAA family ATPase n=1 Tax=unclassified Lysobacter TaxID=2635362 RepID=UPI001BEC0402|nr:MULTISPECIES: AAA family ATPase [unclassified Lysobacter]MBT2747430.1 AAA family ATPase [Lysobacter sp. ISL-42]MBT2750811.1 AAA family ATPase [Lysobacter sp. ISL-50]MBT2778272.1 AAA family ATPase [Lysobacter sp. ISL-54]MBT2784064.1 AAA family ATPase [Lysobacter sp. ISL-52]
MFEFRSLEVVHWDYWQRFQLPLDASIVTVVGPNGSGKTTLLDALRTLLAIEDRDTARDYKTYLRHNGKPHAWLRGVVSNRPDRRGGRPFFPIKDDLVTLACRIRKRGGDWSRDYQIVGGDVPVETLEQGGDWLGVRDYRVRLAGAGLTRAICRVLTLEQGATDKLCQYSPRDLLQLIFDVFEDKAVLDDYQRARTEQFDVEKELQHLGQDLAGLHLRLESAKADVRSFEEGNALRNQRQRLESEIAPKVELADQRNAIEGAKPRLTGLRRALRERESALEEMRSEDAIASGGRDVLAEAIREARRQVVASEQAFTQARDAARDAEMLVKRRDELAKLQAQRGEVDVDALSASVENGRRRQAELRLEAERDRKRAGEISAQTAALSGGGRIVEPFERDFRAGLDQAGIAHHVLTELVEITDPQWSVAVEAVLAPYRHLLVLENPKQARTAWQLGESQQYRHFIVAERAPVTKASAGSLLEVVRFSADPPAWLPRQLDRIRRVTDIEHGSRLPAGQDWITQKGYLRESRGGRHIGGNQHHFGTGARQSQLVELRAEQAVIAQRAQSREAELQELNQRVDADQSRLLGLDATQELVTRAAEFADAQARLPELAEAAGQAAAALAQARAKIDDAADQDKAEGIAAAKRQGQIDALARELRERAQQINGERQSLIQRIVDYRRKRALMPESWRSAVALQAARAEYESASAVRREIERIDDRLSRGGFVTDESCIPLRDKIGADHDELESSIGRREAHLDRAKRLTEEARGAYINVLRATVRRYKKNLAALGELAGIGVDADMPELANNDVALAQAGLSVRFDFDRKGWIGLDDGEASGGQQVMKSLLLLVALLRDEDQPGGFVFIDEPFAHLDVFNIEKVGRFLRATDAQYILTTPITHNLNVFDPSDLVLTTSKRRGGSPWAEAVAVLKRQREDSKAA